MLIEQKFYTEIIKYCEIHKIPIKSGIIPKKHEADIVAYIQDRLESERRATKKQEEATQLRLDYSLGGIMKSLSGKVLNSPIEEYLWDVLEREELSYMARRQYDIGHYRIDIAFPMVKLAVECDGAEYHRANIEQLERDQKRDKYLARKGWRTVRLSGLEIRKDINFCIQKIKECLGDFAVLK